MSDFLYTYLNTNAEIICKAIRIAIGIVLLTRMEGITSNIKKNIIIIYYSIILGAIGGCLINPIKINIIIGGTVGVCLSLFIYKFYKGDYILNFILLFITIYEILETIFYGFKINFSELLKTYDDIYVDYTTIYVKLLCSVFLSFLICFIYKKTKERKVYCIKDNVKYTFLGNYFVLGSLFSRTVDISDVPGNWKDIFIPLLNINYGSGIYFLPIFEIIILVVILIYRHNQILNNKV